MFAGGMALASELARAGAASSSTRSCSTSRRRSSAPQLSIARTGAEFLTVHAVDRKTLDAAVRGRGDSKLKLLGVTVLDQSRARRPDPAGHRHSAGRARAASGHARQGSGLRRRGRFGARGGCDPRSVGPDFLIVTPGIRPKGSASQDQARIVTPAKRDRRRRRLSRGRAADHRGAGPARSGRGDRRRDRVSAFRLARRGAQRSGATTSPHRRRS